MTDKKERPRRWWHTDRDRAGKAARRGSCSLCSFYYIHSPASSYLQVLRAIAFEVNRIAAIIQLAGLKTGDDG